MALPLATVGGKITAAFMNLIVGQVNATAATGVVPTSVAGTGVTVGASGKVSVSGATSVNINGCFTSTYENYRIEYDLTTSGAATVSLVLRVAGVDSATGYDSQRTTSASAAMTAAQALNATSLLLTPSGLISRSVGTLKVYTPAIASATMFAHQVIQTQNPMTTSAFDFSFGGQHRTLSAYDGFTISPASGTFSGTIRIYGLNNN